MQGFLAAMDAYNYRFDLITREDKKRCVDDSIIWGQSIEETFLKTSSTKVEIGHGPPKMMNKPTD